MGNIVINFNKVNYIRYDEENDVTCIHFSKDDFVGIQGNHMEELNQALLGMFNRNTWGAF